MYRLEELDSLNQVLGWTSRGNLWFNTAVNQIFLGQLQQEVSVESNVEVHVVNIRLRLLNVQIQAVVEHANSFSLVAFESPLDQCLQEVVVCWTVLIVNQLIGELELMLGVVHHLLLDAAEDHTVQRHQVLVIEGSRLLEDLVRGVVVSHKGLLVANLSQVQCILRGQHDGNVQDLECTVQDELFAAAVARVQSRDVVEQVSVFVFKFFHSLNQLVQLLLCHFVVVFTSQEVENVNSECLNICLVSGSDASDCVNCLVPLIILNLKLGFLDLGGFEIWENHTRLTEYSNTVFVLLLSLEDLGLAQQGF